MNPTGNVTAMTFPPYFRAACVPIFEERSEFNKVAKVRQIEILLVLFLVSITGEIGEGWLISPGEQHSADMLLRYLEGIPHTTMLVHRSMI